MSVLGGGEEEDVLFLEEGVFELRVVVGVEEGPGVRLQLDRRRGVGGVVVTEAQRGARLALSFSLDEEE
jgi:putative component of toxin-antitoxin plasmid stabilization module